MHILLHQPEIPANTGNIGRTCVATGTVLHLIEPLGFSLSEKAIKRAGMDYWNQLDVRRYMNFEEFLEKNPGGTIEYFDICSGSNYSDPDCLEVWGGKGGYFYNVVNSSYKDRQQFSYREIKKIEDCEMDINSYLGI